MPNDLFLNILARAGLATPDEGRILMALHTEMLPKATPVVCGNTEPLTAPWSIERLPEVWHEPFMWRAAGGAEGMVSRALHADERGWINASFDGSVIAASRLVEFSRAVEREFGIEFGFVHALPKRTPRRRDASGARHSTGSERWGEQTLTVTIHDLRRYVPDVYWATVFGPAYVDLFRRDHLLATPAARVEEWDEAVYVQLTGEIDEFVRDGSEAGALREAVKDHLGADAFYDPLVGEDTDYRVPNRLSPRR